jgi:hypothetical protein
VSEDAIRWMERYNAIVVGDYVRRSQPLPEPFARPPELLYFLRSASSWLRRVAERRAAEERERQKWLSGLKRRWGLVCFGEFPPYRLPWPGGIIGGPYEVISDHTLELHIDWPPECSCVLLDGERASLGGPCPVHSG